MLQLDNPFEFLPLRSESTTPSATDTRLQSLPLADNLSSPCDESIAHGESTSQASSSPSSSSIDTASLERRVHEEPPTTQSVSVQIQPSSSDPTMISVPLSSTNQAGLGHAFGEPVEYGFYPITSKRKLKRKAIALR
ncbi:hypothetical protein HETIRDRAFT_416633 [Heterobasidion irregulare TC 32-1]|uniref:Uncharacterized protein n=1 Tax=Heterobasidion irregulare (strain TC 32-1) TaxID=747525 RepID=W4KAR9_HETIT|nr:uncharacterized protein HETIRDRAFT_416633 [Heterobasidion irregulare TC 32-1]ETW82460.1 hypothetical protein HETIRDRAFT_416633 [Heterobasidion irregulare TC 32-1]